MRSLLLLLLLPLLFLLFVHWRGQVRLILANKNNFENNTRFVGSRFSKNVYENFHI